MAVGFSAIVMDAIIVCGTIGLGILVGRLLKIDRSIALLTACGSAICGAAAVLGIDGAIRPKPYKTAVAVATVVIFGTLSMFLYPILYRAGIFDLSPDMMGLFTGSTVHEVAHVVGAANAMGAEGEQQCHHCEDDKGDDAGTGITGDCMDRCKGCCQKEIIWKMLIPTSLKSAFHGLPFSSW